MMSFSQTLNSVIKILEENQIRYMIVGSVASIVYGESRLTKDIDLVLEISGEKLELFPRLFPEDLYYLPPMEILADEFRRSGQFNVIDQETGFKIDFVFRKNSPHSKIEFERRQSLEILPNVFATLATPEDVILKKLYYFREGGSQKHLEDIRGILAQTKIDHQYLDLWLQNLGLKSIWESEIQ